MHRQTDKRLEQFVYDKCWHICLNMYSVLFYLQMFENVYCYFLHTFDRSEKMYILFCHCIQIKRYVI